MNYLAHLFLSGNSEGLIIGNFIADSVKGSQFNQYPDDIKEGILLHRKIDSFTDKHVVVRQSKLRLMPYFHKYSTVIVDVFYDHFLAANWEEYSPVSLRAFSDSVYALLLEKSEKFPSRSRLFLRYMISYDILFEYRTIEGIGMALNGLSRRARFNSNMQLAHQNLRDDYEKYREEFDVFFKELQIEVLEFRKRIG